MERRKFETVFFFNQTPLLAASLNSRMDRELQIVRYDFASKRFEFIRFDVQVGSNVLSLDSAM